MPPEPTPFPLSQVQTPEAWHLKTSPDFLDLVQSGAIPILPIACLCRWDAAWPLDAEEILLGHLLKQSSAPVLPPFRHCPRQDPRQAFALTAATAWQVLADTVRSIHATGFQKCIFLHAHPLLADWLDCGLRDLRLETGMGLFRMSLEGLGLSLKDDVFLTSITPLILQTPAGSDTLLAPATEKMNELLSQIAKHPLTPPLKN